MRLTMKRPLLLSFVAVLAACAPTTTAGGTASVSEAPGGTPMPDRESTPTTELATFGAGCFWCVEAVLEQLDGVLDVTSGYMGGHVENPTYKAVCTGETGHAEVVQVTFDPAVIPYDHLLAWFWKLHDPTTLNRQGADAGTQYRSAIFYHSEAQREAAEASKAAADASGEFVDPIVTEITAASTYYTGEEYHQDYYRLNRQQGYCRAVIAPKLEKLGLEK
jgi:peptide-methionine (S)-S-oxide reductase